ncbi:Six-hairpin glycosidase [Clavulina sp. PMI_390]|nr:Six-hairpin glycosidase [Clavulina sp. PMI_390]
MNKSSTQRCVHVLSRSSRLLPCSLVLTPNTSSWEMGTASEALLEHNLGSRSVFGSSPAFAPSSSLSQTNLQGVLYFAREALKQKNGSQAIIQDGAAGDPASLGMAVILGNLTDNANTGISGLTFSQAADEEVQYLLNDVPRASNGAISHRVNEIALWADFIYMVPPFLALYGVVTQNTTMIQTAVDQISKYRSVLQDPKTKLWTHVALSPTFNDPTLWATGNAWAAAGIVRTLATIQNSQFSSKFGSQKSELTSWAVEIHTGFYKLVNTTYNLPHNTLNDSSTFYDGASAALMASSVYRLAVLSKKYAAVPHAESFYSTLVSNTDSQTNSNTNSNNTVRLDTNGWLTPVVNPTTFSTLGSESPEGESFVLLVDAARSDWVSKGSAGKTGAASRRWTGDGLTGSVAVALVAVLAGALAHTL